MSDDGSETPLVTRRRYLAASKLTAAGTIGGSLGYLPVTVAAHENRDVVIESRAEDDLEIHATLYRPAGADADTPVPVIIHSHGWSGSRTSSDGAFREQLDRGFGVLSFDQRGHGDTGGRTEVMDPDYEGLDVVALLDFLSSLEWVLRSRDDDGDPIPDDPMVVAMGGSYGGGFQFMGAFTETALRGDTRFDALCPQITWFNLSESLAPQKVPRTAWLTLLTAVGASMHHPENTAAVAYAIASGRWADGTEPGIPNSYRDTFENGPSGFVEKGIELDIPVLIGQGTSDNLFPLNEGWHNFERSLSDEAREASALIGYNGGHSLPKVLPSGVAEGGDVCSIDGDFGELQMQFFEAIRDDTGDARDLVGSAYAITTADGTSCLQVGRLDHRIEVPTGLAVQLTDDDGSGLEVTAVDGVIDSSTVGEVADVQAALGRTGGEAIADAVSEAEATLAAHTGEYTASDEDSGGVVATPTGYGPPINLELREGPLTVVGVPTMSASVTSVGVEQRVFCALAVGDSPATAEVLQHNVLPLREELPVTGAERTIELPGVATEVDEDETLYLTISPISDYSFGHGSVRTPGSILLEDLTVDVPVPPNEARGPPDHSGRPEDAGPTTESGPPGDRA